MKTIIILNLFILSILTSCSKQEAAVNKNQQLIADVVAIKNPEAQKVSYNLMSDINKSLSWKQHLNLYLGDKMLSHGQKEIIQYFKNVIVPDIFKSKQAGQEFLSRKDISELLYTAKKEFNIGQIYKIFGTLSTDKETVNFEEAPGSRCYCNASQDFCEGANVHCYQNMWNCTVTPNGCGWLWIQECNGRCGWMPS
jgi:hypothetical protein